MTKLLIMNHRGVSVPALVEQLRRLGTDVNLVEPESFHWRTGASGFDGVIASGGYLRSKTHRETLNAYSSFLEELLVPFFGICLGLRILGHCHGARFRKTEPVTGIQRVTLSGFPLCPQLSSFPAHQNHRYELLRPLPETLQDFSVGHDVQAVKVVGMDQYAVQFHPEVGNGPAATTIENFVLLCSTGKPKHAQGT